MDARFDAVEKALGTLINSITSFNPSISQAQDLVAAQEELLAGLVQLEIHQNNYLRIQQLQEETATFDTQIKDTMTLIWETRKEVKATPVTKAPASRLGSDFSYTDLLNYASRISRTTLPPPGVTNGVNLSAQPTADGETPTSAITNNQPSANGAVPGPDPSTASITSPSTGQPQPIASGSSTALPAHMLPAVNLLEGAVFYPWPSEERIRSGALAACQRLADRGIDPKNYDPDEEERVKKAAELEQQRLAAAEEEARRERERIAAEKRQRDRERMAREREEMARRVSSGTNAGPAPTNAGPAPRKQFQFAGGLDDDDDDDE